MRAVGTADLGPGLRVGLESLEHSAIAIRSMFRAVLDAARDDAWLDDDVSAEEVSLSVAYTLRELAAGVDAFGQLVHDEGDPTVRITSTDVDAMRTALDGMHEARARLEDALLAGGPSELIELNAAMLGTVKRVLQELDLDERVRRQLRLARRPRPPRSGPPTGVPPAGHPALPEPDPDAETQHLPLIPPGEAPSLGRVWKRCGEGGRGIRARLGEPGERERSVLRRASRARPIGMRGRERRRRFDRHGLASSRVLRPVRGRPDAPSLSACSWSSLRSRRCCAASGRR